MIIHNHDYDHRVSHTRNVLMHAYLHENVGV